MKFQFSIRQALRESWDIVFSRPSFFIVVGLVFLVISYFSGIDAGFIVLVAASIAGVIWDYVQIGIGFAAVDGKKDMLSLKKLSEFFPDLKHTVEFFAVSFLFALVCIVGLVALVIPGIYLWVRLTFARNAYLDRREGIKAALRYSWDITEGKFWTVFAADMASLGVMVLGMIVFFFGLAVAYPVVIVFKTKLYRALANEYQAARAVEVQPEELPAA